MKVSPLLLSIIILFLMLWLPLGQYDFLIAHWMKLGLYVIPFIFIGIFTFYEKQSRRSWQSDLRFWAVLALVAYILHQYEEHWIDLYGNYYAFYDYNNNLLRGVLGATDTEIRPLSPESIFMINTSLVWLVAAMAIWRSPRHLFPFIAMAHIIIFNGLVHIMASLVSFKYNPGLVTSLFIFVPYYILCIRQIRQVLVNYKFQIMIGWIWAFLAHVIMVGGLLLANWFHLIPELAYFMVLVIWSLVPLVLFRQDQGVRLA